MYRNYLPLGLTAILALLLVACNQESLQPTQTVALLDRAAINERVIQHLQSTETVFDWNEADEQLVFSALALSNHEAAIGYQPAGFVDLPQRIHEIEVGSGTWKATRNAILQYVLEETNRLQPNEPLTEAELFVAPEDGVLPIIELRIYHPEVLAGLRARADVRYVEPANYQPEVAVRRSDSGCGVGPDFNIPAADFVTTSPNAKIPWNYYLSNIPTAWNRSRGDDIGICVIDTGSDDDQYNLQGGFTAGNSGGRYIQRYGTYAGGWFNSRPDGPDDRCGHGTQMAGLAAGPRGSSGATVGVAYQANLITVRGTSDVVVNGSSEKRGVKDALVLAGNRSDVQIISMSIGDVFSSGTVKDGVRYAYNRGKLIFAAAGTSLSWTSWWGVIFPASMNETVAVTGVKEGSPMQRCNTCHDGSKVDFVIAMQRRNDNNRTSLTLAPSGNQPTYVSGSSTATATTAGIAALVWATNPGQNRSQVLDRLKQSASFYPSRSGNFGWGLIDANQAVN